MYSGTNHNTTEGYIGISAFNTSYNSPVYVGYKYGTSIGSNRQNTNDSTIKKYVDNWYNNNLSSYSKYISTEAVYCNDRELEPGQEYSDNPFNYAPTGRYSTTKTPTYNCTNIKDAFSGNNGEAKLTYSIGLMTIDEIVYAGENSYAWYYLNSAGESITGSTLWWTLSPTWYMGGNSSVWKVYGSSNSGKNPGSLDIIIVGNPLGVRPAISLKSCTLYSTGDGSVSDPYTIKETTSGC